MLPPLATVADLTPLLGPDVDDVRAAAALGNASALVRSYLRLSFVGEDGLLDEDVPDGVVTATVNIARRAYLAPNDDVSQEAIGPYSVQRTGGLYLSSTDKALLAPFRGRSGVQSVTVDGPLPPFPDEVFYAATSTGGDPVRLTWQEVPPELP